MVPMQNSFPSKVNSISISMSQVGTEYQDISCDAIDGLIDLYSLHVSDILIEDRPEFPLIREEIINPSDREYEVIANNMTAVVPFHCAYQKYVDLISYRVLRSARMAQSLSVQHQRSCIRRQKDTQLSLYSSKYRIT
jgi:hypothetical protein